MPNLLVRLSDAPTISAGFGATVTSPERTDVIYLQMSVQAIRSGNRKYQVLGEVAERFRTLAHSGDFATLYDEYKVQTLWPLAELASAQGKPIFTTPDPDAAGDIDPSQAAYHWLEDAGDEDMMVDLPGSRALGFKYGSSNPARAARGKVLARRTSRAFAFRRRDDLVDYFKVIRDECRSIVAEGTTLAVDVEAEVARFNRLQIEFMLSNVGRAGVSIASDGAAVIAMQGYVHAERPGGPAAPMSADLSLPLRIRTETDIPRAEQAAAQASIASLAADEAMPILLPAGTTMRLVATSDVLLADLPTGAALINAYVGGERRVRLLLGRFARGSWPSRNGSALSRFESGRVLFRDLRFGSLI